MPAIDVQPQPRISLQRLDPALALLQRLREHFPLTLQGVIALALLLLALQVFGYGAMDLVVFALAICAIAILLFSLFCVIFGGLMQQLKIRTRINSQQFSDGPIRLEAGYPNETGFELKDLGIFPLIKLSWEVVYPDYLRTRIRYSAEGNRLIEEIIPEKRCRSMHLVRLFTVSDVLGFCRYSWRQKQQLEVVALPRSNTIKTLPILRSLTSEDGIPSPSGNPEGDRMEIRPYAPGDSVRNIMWKAYARNRQLNVRLAEKSVFQSNRTIAYLISGPDDEAAAAVARVAIDSGALGDDWAFGADGTDSISTDVESAMLAIAGSRALDEPYGYGLDTFLQYHGSQAGCHCVVFAAAVTGPWVSRLRHTIGRFGGQFTLVLATDGLNDPADEKFWRRLIFKEPDQASRVPHFNPDRRVSGKKELGSLLTELSQSVESTLLVDRTTGLSFDQTMRKL